MLHMFKLKHYENTVRVDNRSGRTIGFIDNEPSRTSDQILELMHNAYIQGTADGRKEKCKDIMQLLKQLLKL